MQDTPDSGTVIGISYSGSEQLDVKNVARTTGDTLIDFLAAEVRDRNGDDVVDENDVLVLTAGVTVLAVTGDQMKGGVYHER